MAWDTEGTKRKILEAAASEFARCGPDGTTIERIAGLAGVNKERVYNYFGGKTVLFARVLREQLAAAAENVPAESFATHDIGDYAARLYDYHCEHPELIRLLQWEALTVEAEVPEEEQRTTFYGRKTAAIQDGQAAGVLTSALEPDLLNFLVTAMAGYWAAMPHVARMMTGSPDDLAAEHARRRASVAEGARRLTSPALPPMSAV